MAINSGGIVLGGKNNTISNLNIGTITGITMGNTEIKNFQSNGLTATFDLPTLAVGERIGVLSNNEATVIGTGGTVQETFTVSPPMGWSIVVLSLSGDLSNTVFEGMSIPPISGDRLVMPTLITITPAGIITDNQYDVDRVYLIRSDGIVEGIDISAGDGDGLYSFDFDVLNSDGDPIPNSDGIEAKLYLINPSDNTYRVFTSSIQSGSINFIVGGLVSGGGYEVELIVNTVPPMGVPRHVAIPTKLY